MAPFDFEPQSETLTFNGRDLTIRGLTDEEVTAAGAPMLRALAAAFAEGSGTDPNALLQDGAFVQELMLSIMGRLPAVVANILALGTDQLDPAELVEQMPTLVALDRIGALSAAHADHPEHGDAATRHSRSNATIRH